MIAGASNMQFVLEELIDSFESQENIACQAIYGSSGKLTAQITEGAPYDVLLSADMKYPEFLHVQKLASEPTIFARGNLVLWTNNGPKDLDLYAIAKTPSNKIAMANPELAPYGKVAQVYLKEINLFKALQNQLIYGENVAQTSQFIYSKSVRAGFTAKSVVLSKEMKDKGVWKDITCKQCPPLRQGAVVLHNGRNKTKEAQLFIDFLKGEKAKEILNKYGYSTTFDSIRKKQN